jgi:hypothetical protein
VDVEDQIIRDGVLAKLAERQLQIQRWSDSSAWHWTRFQASTDRLAKVLLQHDATIDAYRKSEAKRIAAIEKFREYAMKWY